MLYSHLWRVCFYHNFFTLSHKKHNFMREIFWIKTAALTCARLYGETFLILRRIQRDIIINVLWSSCKVQLFLSNFNEMCIFWTDIERYLNIKFYENAVNWSQVVLWRRNYRETWSTQHSLFVYTHKNGKSRRKGRKYRVLTEREMRGGGYRWKNEGMKRGSSRRRLRQ